MPDINPILVSSGHYKQAFEEGLTRILEYKTAGTFILACANLFQHPDFLNNNKTLLHEVYDYIKEHYQACHHDGRQPEDAPDDIAVMKNLLDIGLDNLETVEYSTVNNDGVDYLLNYNQLRSFRPARMSKTDNIQLDSPFSPDGFHFAKPFLKKEIFAEAEIDDVQLSLLYNKFPFIHYHALLVVDKEKRNNQYLTQNYLNFITKVQNHTQKHCPEFVIAYNSLGAGASVNHLHFHAYLETTPLAIFSPEFAHNGGDKQYPATCQVFTNSMEAWQRIKILHNNNIPYNLIFRNNRVYCLPRHIPSRASPDNKLPGIDTSVFGWSQMAGLLNVDNREMLTKLTATQIKSSLESASALNY